MIKQKFSARWRRTRYRYRGKTNCQRISNCCCCHSPRNCRVVLEIRFTGEQSYLLDTPTQTKIEFKYFNTFGGNAVACAAAEAVLDIIEDEDLKGNALEVGNYILNGIEKLRKQYPEMISDIRGYGLFIGIEMLTSDGLPNSHDAYRIRSVVVDSDFGDKCW